MTRFLAFAGVVALSFTQPAISLAEPAPPAPVVVPMPVRAPLPAHRPAPAPGRPGQPNRSGTQGGGDVVVPFDVNVRPKPLPQTVEHPALKAAPELIPYWYDWRGLRWGRSPGLFLSPVPCPASSGFSGPWGTLPTSTDLLTPGVTLGSLIDGQSRNVLSASPSYPLYGAAVELSDPVLRSGYQPVPCGSSYFFPL